MSNKYNSLYEWLKSNVQYTENPAIIVGVGTYTSSLDTLYGNYQKYCLDNNLPKIGLANFTTLILEYFNEKNLPVELIIQYNRKFIRRLILINSTIFSSFYNKGFFD